MKHVPPKHKLTAPKHWFDIFWAGGGWFAIAAAAICVVITGVSIWLYSEATIFDRTGVEITARAVDRRVSRGSDGDDDYYVTYRYIVDNRVFERSRRVSSDQYDKAAEGTTHVVRYLPQNPRRFETYVGEARDDARGFQIAAGVVGVIGLGALWFFGSRTNRAVLTRRYGYHAVAKVERITETDNSGRPSGRGYLTWRRPDGGRDESMMHPIGPLRAIGVGAEINIYVRKGHSVWEGDVGPQEADESAMPKVSRGDQ